MDANTKEYAQDPTNLYLKLARQEGTISLWNLQDILLQKIYNNQPFDYIYPKSGAPILVDGVGIVKNAKNEANAKLFYEFLFDQEVRDRTCGRITKFRHVQILQRSICRIGIKIWI